MKSMLKFHRRSQDVPNRKNGLVIGVDISKGKIDYGIFGIKEYSKVQTIKQDAQGFSQLQKQINELKSSNYDVWLGYESTGPYGVCFKEWISSCDIKVVQVNGYHVKRIKEVRDNSPLKSDRKDPMVISDLVWQGCYQESSNITGYYAELRSCASEWSSLSKKRTALKNEIQSHMELWFPEIKDVFKDIVCKSVRELLKNYTSPEDIHKNGLEKLSNVLLRSTRNRSDRIYNLSKSSVCSRKGNTQRHKSILFSIELLDKIESRQSSLRKEMEEILSYIPESSYLMSMPGVGVIFSTSILGECGDLKHFNSYRSFEKYIGMNLYEISSGKHKGKKRISKRGSALARYVLCQISISQIRSGGLYNNYANDLKLKGKSIGEIRIAVGRKILKVIFGLCRKNELFNYERFIGVKRTEDDLVTHQETQQDKVA